MISQKKSIVVDIDGTLCPLKKDGESYADLIPYDVMVDALLAWRVNGGYIQLYTSRNMRTYDGNLGLINANTAPILLEWLKKWNIPYDELVFGKPWPGVDGFYVDDRSIRPREFLENTIEQIEMLIKGDRLGSR